MTLPVAAVPATRPGTVLAPVESRSRKSYLLFRGVAVPPPNAPMLNVGEPTLGRKCTGKVVSFVPGGFGVVVSIFVVTRTPAEPAAPVSWMESCSSRSIVRPAWSESIVAVNSVTTVSSRRRASRSR